MRALIFKLHKWLGLYGALFFLLIFTTGALLTVGDEIDSLLAPKIRPPSGIVAHDASFGALYEAARAKAPAGVIVAIEPSEVAVKGHRIDVFGLEGGRRWFWADPATSEIYATSGTRLFRDIVIELHDSLWVPSKIIGIAVAASSIVLMFMLVSGLISYRRFWRGLFRWPDADAAPRARWGMLHRLFGLWAGLFAIIIAVTGMFFLLDILGMAGTYKNRPEVAPRAEVLPQTINGSALDSIVADAKAHHPGMKVTALHLPGQPNEPISVHGDLAPLAWANSRVLYYDPSTSALIDDQGPEHLGGLTKFGAAMNSLHFGTWGGNASRYLWFVLGLLLASVVVAGVKVSGNRTAAADGTGGFQGHWQNMGPVRFLYILLVLGLVAMFVLRFVL